MTYPEQKTTFSPSLLSEHALIQTVFATLPAVVEFVNFIAQGYVRTICTRGVFVAEFVLPSTRLYKRYPRCYNAWTVWGRKKP